MNIFKTKSLHYIIKKVVYPAGYHNVMISTRINLMYASPGMFITKDHLMILNLFHSCFEMFNNQ